MFHCGIQWNGESLGFRTSQTNDISIEIMNESPLVVICFETTIHMTWANLVPIPLS